MAQTKIKTSQALICYEGVRVGVIVLRDIVFDVDGVPCNMEIVPGGQVRVKISADILNSLRTGTLSYYTADTKWDGDPPLKVYLLVRA